LFYQRDCVLIGHAFGVRGDDAVSVELRYCDGGGEGFRGATARVRVDDLPVQVAPLHHIRVGEM
jgi:hypothetical protein|tara:strand:+ start:1088 stop:1279 length:192 start_codon:yes stop_codon:yes gene_type:complete